MLESSIRAVAAFFGWGGANGVGTPRKPATRVVVRGQPRAGKPDRIVTWWIGGAAISTVAAFVIFLTHGPMQAAAKRLESLPPFMLNSDGLRVQAPSGPLWTERDLDRIMSRLATLETEKAALQGRIASLENRSADVTGSLPDKPVRPVESPKPGGLAIDLGGFRSLAGLRTRLADIRRQVPDLMIPGVRALTADLGPDQVEVRLLVGPLKGAEDVLAACAKLKAAQIAPCLPAALAGTPVEAR